MNPGEIAQKIAELEKYKAQCLANANFAAGNIATYKEWLATLEDNSDETADKTTVPLGVENSDKGSKKGSSQKG